MEAFECSLKINWINSLLCLNVLISKTPQMPCIDQGFQNHQHELPVYCFYYQSEPLQAWLDGWSIWLFCLRSSMICSGICRKSHCTTANIINVYPFQEPHVNTCYKHFYYFVREFDLVSSKELEPLKEMTSRVCRDYSSPPATSSWLSSHGNKYEGTHLLSSSMVEFIIHLHLHLSLLYRKSQFSVVSSWKEWNLIFV